MNIEALGFIKVKDVCYFCDTNNKKEKMFDYQFPTWLPVLFFVVLLLASFAIGAWLVKKDRKY